MVKLYSIFVPVLSLSLLFLLFLPVLTKPQYGKILNVSIHEPSPAVRSSAPAAAAAAVEIPAEAVITAAPPAEIVPTAAPAAAADPAPAEAFAAPVPQSGLVAESAETLTYPGLDEFASALLNGSPDDVVGVYAHDVLALPVMQQPSGQPDFVSAEPNMLTQFYMPKTHGVVGILAHNYLSGSRFTQLAEGAEIVLVFGGGQMQRYTVTRAESYQALNPTSPFSNFVDTSDPGKNVMTSAQLFKHIYTVPGRLVLQTCIESGGEPSWGRLFVIAEPAGALNLAVPALDTINDLN